MDATGSSQALQTPDRKISSSSSHKDVWFVVREGSLNDVKLALALLKKNGVNINSRNTFGLTPLHIATRRNHIPIIRRLLAAGADPDARDRESGWSSLHRALHFGHLAVASILLQHGASITLEDSKSRIPVDLLSGPVFQAFRNECNSGVTATGDVYMWDGKKGKEKPPVATRLPGVKRATSVSVGETHLLIVASLCHPVYPHNAMETSRELKLK